MQLNLLLSKTQPDVTVEIYSIDRGGLSSYCCSGPAGELSKRPACANVNALAICRAPEGDALEIYIG